MNEGRPSPQRRPEALSAGGNERLSPREKAFLAAFLAGENPADAARTAGYAPARAEITGRRLLALPRIRAALERARQTLEENQPVSSLRQTVTEERILRELCAVAFSDFTGFIRVEDGAAVVTDSRGLDPAQRAAIAGIKDTGRGVEIKLHDKEKALELLVKYLGLFGQSPEETGIRVELSGIPDLWAE